MKNPLFYLLIVAVLGAVVYLVVSRTPKPTESRKLVTQTSKQEEAKYTLDIEYPKIEGEDIVNKQVEGIIKNITDNFITQAQNNDFNVIKAKSGLTIRYDYSYLTPGILSVGFNISEYLAGMAHPNNYSEEFNYDFEGKRRLQLADLFKQDSSYLKVLSEYAVDDLGKQNAKVQFSDSDWIKKGASPSAENYQKFLLGKDDLTLIFDVYQVGPYAAGAKKVEIPYKALPLAEEIYASLQI